MTEKIFLLGVTALNIFTFETRKLKVGMHFIKVLIYCVIFLE